MLSKFYKVAIALISLAATSSLSHAQDVKSGGLFIEPAVTYETSTSHINFPSPLSDSTGKVHGLGISAKFGIHIQEAFFAGIDARYSMPTFEDSSTGYNAKAVSTNYGPIVGMQMPVAGLRLWASYVLGGDLDPEKSGAYDFKFSQATGYRIGAGFHVSVVSLNIEYQDLKYGRSTVQQVGPIATNMNFDNVDLKNKTWVASVSFPIEL